MMKKFPTNTSLRHHRFVSFLPQISTRKKRLSAHADEVKISPYIATVISIVALFSSVTSIYLSQIAHRDRANSGIINSEYEHFYDTTRMEIDNWQIAHLFALPKNYNLISRRVLLANSPITPTKRAELLLKEKGQANYIFNAFEGAFYQWQHAKKIGDKERAAFLAEILDYYTSKPLRNPRLLWYWDAKGGGLSEYEEAQTQKYYEAKVLHDPLKPIKIAPDPFGPFQSTSPPE